MTFDQLRIFVVVAETLNMRQAGELLHLTQPAVSAAITALETRHDTRLFERVGRGLELSAAGRSFLPEARAVLARAEDAQRVLADLSGLVHGEVRIVASQTVTTYWLPSRMARFVETYPGISVPLVAGNSATAAAAVLAGEADLGFVEGHIDGDLLRVQRVGGDRLGLYAASGHPLAGQPVESADLQRAAWVVREPGSGTREHLQAGLARHGLNLDVLTVRLVLPSNGAVLEAVGAGGLIAAVSDLAAASRLATGQVVRLHYELPPRDFRVITHRARRASRAVAAFMQSLGMP
ncbi:LysR family transcriptional regulator [Alicycliphilus denitrificans]|uniref:LysR family transcriptional regulator n=1 Tax=Alicycliphilus denitrificans TaxID=179636 RepID=A0A858ZRV8_9BURK|nr:LysR family transcriptional regulator [Alicycliphilus denitrificans]QKD43568.1 LysR family transcriptional regulator [Alicycliphilus denitrificans]